MLFCYESCMAVLIYQLACSSGVYSLCHVYSWECDFHNFVFHENTYALKYLISVQSCPGIFGHNKPICD